jgi:hypothetical protein
MRIAWAVLAQGREVARRSVPFVFGEAVTRVLSVKLREQTIAVNLRDD